VEQSIVFVPPRLDDLLGFRQGREPVHVQALGSQGIVERLHMRIVGRLAGREKSIRTWLWYAHRSMI